MIHTFALIVALLGLGRTDLSQLLVSLEPEQPSGELRLLTYNIAGLPEWVSRSSPSRNTGVIGGLLGGYDIALVQEDFCYHQALDRTATHPHRSAPEFPRGCRNMFGPSADLGDGLNRFAHLPFSDFGRDDWTTCSGRFECGNDCFAPKGFTRATHTLAHGIVVDVYNLHMDSGRCPGDYDARRAQIAQLMTAIEARSKGRAVIVAGDTNFSGRSPTDTRVYARALRRAGFQDACEARRCGPGRLDRVFLRSGPDLDLSVLDWWMPEEFVDAGGRDLSDHKPVAVRIGWRRPRVAGR